MIYRTFQFGFKELNINILQIESVMGCSKSESHETVSELIAEVLKEAEDFCDIKAEFRIFSRIHFNDHGKTVEINDLVFNVNNIVFNQIKRSDTIAVFLCTAGKETGIRGSKAMKDGDYLKGYIYDVIGSEIVETAADMMQNELDKEIIPAGKRSTNRFSPGYCDWSVTEQKHLFRLLDANAVGVQLNDSCLMQPRKSISGVFGLYPHHDGRIYKIYNPFNQCM